MRAGSAFASGTRHVVGMALQAFLIVAIVAALSVAAAMAYGSAPVGADSVFAARGTTTYSQIDLDVSSSARVQYTRGSDVRFATKVVGLKGTEYPLVLVECFSDGYGKVYAQLDDPNATFVLGGGSSLWLLLDPSPSATCYAHLYAYGGKTRGGRDVIRELTDPAVGVLEFSAAGA